MRKSIIFVLCLFFVSLSYGQSASNERFSVSVDLGAGQSFGKSNLSPYGVGYRGEYKSGFSGNIKMNYLLGKAFQAGLKFNLFSDAGNYGVASDAQVADNLNLTYIAPQIGVRVPVSDKWHFDCMIGAGYMNYHCESLYNSTEQTFKKGFFGANADLSLCRRIYGNLFLGANLSVMGGHASSLKATAGNDKNTLKLDKWNRINVLRADFGLSVKAML